MELGSAKAEIEYGEHQIKSQITNFRVGIILTISIFLFRLSFYIKKESIFTLEFKISE